MGASIKFVPHDLLLQAQESLVSMLAGASMLALEEFNAIRHIEQKPDISLVTSADKAIETMMVAAIRKAFPQHKIIGEEYGCSNSPESDFVWLIDPIDGTENFVNGVPTYGCLVGLHYKENPSWQAQPIQALA